MEVLIGLPATAEAEMAGYLVSHMSPAALVAALGDREVPVGSQDLVAMAVLLRLSKRPGRLSETWRLARDQSIDLLTQRLIHESSTPALRRLAICVAVITSHRLTHGTTLWNIATTTLSDWAANAPTREPGFVTELDLKLGTMAAQTAGSIHEATIRRIRAKLATSLGPGGTS